VLPGLRFLAETLHPIVRSDRDEVERPRAEYNRILRPDRVEIRQVSTISGRPVFAGGPATPRNIQPHTARKAIGRSSWPPSTPGSRSGTYRSAARHADPRTTTIYDRRRQNFDRHAAYVVVAFVAGG